MAYIKDYMFAYRASVEIYIVPLQPIGDLLHGISEFAENRYEVLCMLLPLVPI
jgi:hypothetical protein